MSYDLKQITFISDFVTIVTHITNISVKYTYVGSDVTIFLSLLAHISNRESSYGITVMQFSTYFQM